LQNLDLGQQKMCTAAAAKQHCSGRLLLQRLLQQHSGCQGLFGGGWVVV
jgi:hypothetical protein